MENNLNGAGAEIPEAEPVAAAEAERQEAVTAENAETEAVETAPEPPKDEGDDQKKEQKKRTKEFIERLKQEKREKEQRIRELEEQLARTKAEKPKREDFEDEDDYADARAEYREEKARQKALAEEVARQAQERERTRAEAWRLRVAEASSEIPDLERVITNPYVPITKAMAETLMDSEYGPHVAYKLAKNPSLAAEIAAMSDREAARAIGRLEAEVSPKPRTISKAPAPVDIVGGKDAAPGFDPARASPDDFARMFRQNKR